MSAISDDYVFGDDAENEIFGNFDDSIFDDPPRGEPQQQEQQQQQQFGEPQQQEQQQQQQFYEEDDEEAESTAMDETIPAVELTAAERKREKNRKKMLKKRAKQRERMVCGEMQIASGEKSRFEIEKSNFRRRLEGTMMRKRGILRQEADAEIERLLENWRQDV